MKRRVNVKGHVSPKGSGGQLSSKDVKPGDIYYTIWGYDQTNYNYIVVKSISPTGKTAICQVAKYSTLGSNGFVVEQKPRAEGYGVLFKMKIDRSYLDDGYPTLRGSFPFTDPVKRPDDRFRATFRKAKVGQTFYETDPRAGH